MPRHALRRVALRCVALASGGGQGPRRLPVPRREHPDVSRVSELGVRENEVAVHGGHAFRVSVSCSSVAAHKWRRRPQYPGDTLLRLPTSILNMSDVSHLHNLLHSRTKL